MDPKLSTSQLVRAANLSLTPRSLTLFLEYAADAANWSGTPLVGGNVGGSKEDRGNLTQLKRAGLIETLEEHEPGQGRCTWIRFTAAGIQLAAEHGITNLTGE